MLDGFSKMCEKHFALKWQIATGAARQSCLYTASTKTLRVIYLEMKLQNLKHIANRVLLLNDCGSITSSLILDIILCASNSSCR